MSSSEFDFYKYFNLVKRNKTLFAAFALAIMSCSVLVAYVLPKKYEAKSTVFIEKNVISELVKGITATPSMEDSIKVLTYALGSRTLLLKVISEVDFDLKDKSDAAIEQLIRDLQKNTDVKVNNKELFVISFRHTDPRIARDYVNALVRMYIEENISAKRAESYDATKFLSEQIKTFKERMDKAETSLNSYKNSAGAVVSIDEGRLVQEINNSQQKLQEMQVKKNLLEEQKKFAETEADPLQLQLAALQKKLDTLRVDFSDKYPEVINTKNHIASLQQEIKAKKGPSSPGAAQEIWKIDAELKAVQENIRFLERYLADNKRLLATIPSARASIGKLEEEKNVQKNMYDLLFLRHNQSEVSKQMELQDKSTTFRIVDAAVKPIKPVSPNRKKILLMGIAAGLVGAFGLLLLIDYLKPSVSTVDSLRGLNFPVLAIIPLIRSDEEILAARDADFRLYIVSAACFMVILAVLAMEVLGIGLMDAIMNRLYIPQMASKLLGRFL